MKYIDLDGVLANLQKWCYEIDNTSFDSNENFVNFALNHLDEIFLKSEPIEENFRFLKGEYRILTSLPSIKYFKIPQDELQVVITKLKHNKIEWCKNYNIPIKNVIITNSPSEKLLYCNSNDILYDDYQRNIDKWNSKGGKGKLVENKFFNNVLKERMIKLNRI